MKPSRLVKEWRARFIKWLDPDTWFPRSGGYYGTESGIMVNAETSMRVSAVFACVRILAWTIASLPLPIYRRMTPRGKKRAVNHPLYALLHDAPNPEQTSFQFRALLMTHVALWGNAYAEIEADALGNIIALWPLPPWRVEPLRSKTTGSLYYEVALPDGTKKEIPAYSMLHIMGIGTDGLKGLSVIGVARQSIGLSLAAEEFGARFFGGGANMGGVAEAPGKLDDKTYKRLKDSLDEKYSGLGNAHRILLLEEGLKYTRVGIPPNDAQFLETRKFQITDVARIFGIPSFMINDTEKTSSWGTGIEQMGIGLVVYTMRPWCVNWEQEIQRKLLIGDPEYFAEFLLDGLLRGDTASRYASYAIGRQWGWLSADDVLELENRNPLPDNQGSIYLNPLNMISAANYLTRTPAIIPGATPVQPKGQEPDGENEPEEDRGGDPKTDDAKNEFDTYGIGVRAGSITPQIEDEDHFRTRVGLPPLSADARKSWARENNVRRPVTLTPISGSGGAAPEVTVAATSDRMKIIGGFRFVLVDAAKRILKREEADVVRQARKLSGQPFDAWLERFYQEHADYMGRQYEPALRGIGEAAGGSFDLSAFITTYTADRLSQLRGVVTRAVAQKANVADCLQTVFADYLVADPAPTADAIVQRIGATS